MIGVYKITNMMTGDAYVGASRCVEHRKTQHFARTRQGHSKRFDDDIDTYGREAFKFEVLEECGIDDLAERELYHILALRPSYNRSWKGCKMDETYRSKVSEAMRRWWRDMPPELQAKLKANLTGPRVGHEVSAETRQKISQKLCGKKQPPELIEKRRQGILARHAIHPQTNAGHRKRVVADGIEFESVKACAEHLGVNASNVSAAIKKGHKVKGCAVRFAV